MNKTALVVTITTITTLSGLVACAGGPSETTAGSQSISSTAGKKDAAAEESAEACFTTCVKSDAKAKEIGSKALACMQTCESKKDAKAQEACFNACESATTNLCKASPSSCKKLDECDAKCFQDGQTGKPGNPDGSGGKPGSPDDEGPFDDGYEGGYGGYEGGYDEGYGGYEGGWDDGYDGYEGGYDD